MAVPVAITAEGGREQTQAATARTGRPGPRRKQGIGAPVEAAADGRQIRVKAKFKD